MTHKRRLKKFLIASSISWVVTLAILGFVTFSLLSLPLWLGLIALLVATAFLSMNAINQAQLDVAEVNKAHSATKRLVQEHRLTIDRFEYDAKKAGELRRIGLNSTQEKDHALRNMAAALDYSMDDILKAASTLEGESATKIELRAQNMKRYAADLKALARLALKADLPDYQEHDFIDQIDSMISHWADVGKTRDVAIKLDNPEDQMPMLSDASWFDNVLSRIALALIRMNDATTLNVNLIGYLDADLGDALRVQFVINGRRFEDKQLKHLTSEYVSIIDDGQEVGPGLTFVVAQRIARLLHGFIDVTNTQDGVEVILVLPRQPLSKDSDGAA